MEEMHRARHEECPRSQSARLSWYLVPQKLLVHYIHMMGSPRPWSLVTDSTFSPWSLVIDSTFSPWSLVIDSTFSPWSLMTDPTFSPCH